VNVAVTASLCSNELSPTLRSTSRNRPPVVAFLVATVPRVVVVPVATPAAPVLQKVEATVRRVAVVPSAKRGVGLRAAPLLQKVEMKTGQRAEGHTLPPYTR
jgi:hypothetical protein